MTKAAREAVRAKGHRTRQTILDAAELLFGQTDYDSISMRDVAEKANVLLGAVSYHFGNKGALFEAVVTRRADELNGIRLDALRRYENPTIDQIVDAFVTPVLEHNLDPNWNSYVRIMSQVYYQERWQDMQLRLFAPFGKAFVESAKRAQPSTPEDLIESAFLYSIMILLGVSTRPFVEEGKSKVDEQARTVKNFIVGGLQAMRPQSAP